MALSDCSDLETLKISRPACLAIVASACEVYPKECVGTLCCLRPPKRAGKVVAAFPFQIANRARYEVESESYGFFNKMAKKGGPWAILGSYHSHPHPGKGYSHYGTPSRSDLDSMDDGDLELIVRVQRRRKRNVNAWNSTSGGNIQVSWGKFQFLLRAFVKEGPKEYRQVYLSLE